MGMRIRGGAARQLQVLFDSGAVGSLTDGELLARFLRGGSGSEHAFEALVDRHSRMVIRVCFDVLGDPHDAQDAAQATFFILARKARSIRNPDALASWLHGTARRVAGRALRDSIRRRRHERRSVAISETKPTESETPRSWAELHEELAKLPDRYRDPIILCDLTGLTHEQAAERLGCPPRTVETRLYRGRERLKGKLIRRGLAPSAGLVGLVWSSTSHAALSQGWVASTATASVQVAKAGGWAATMLGSAVAVGLAKGTLKEMFMTKLKIFTATTLLIGIVAGGAWSRMASPVRAKPQGLPQGNPRAVVLADAPKPPDAFERAYALADGEDIKLLSGPAIEARNEHFKGDGNKFGMGTNPIDLTGLCTVVFRWRDGKMRWTTNMSGHDPGIELRSLLHSMLGVRGQEIEGDPALIGKQMRFDVIVRDDVPPEMLALQLETILRRDFNLPIRLSLRNEPRDVVVVRGKYQYKPIAEPKPMGNLHLNKEDDWIVIYARGEGEQTDNRRSQVVSGSDLPNLFSELGMYIGLRVVDEVQTRPKRRLDWQITDYNLIRKVEAPEDRELVLKHLAEQTGLTFHLEKRVVRVLRVEQDH